MSLMWENDHCSKESCCLLSLLSINSRKWQKNKGSRAVWEVCITPSASEGFSLVKGAHTGGGRTLWNANKWCSFLQATCSLPHCWIVLVLSLRWEGEGTRESSKRSVPVMGSYGSVLQNSVRKNLSWSQMTSKGAFPRSASYHAFWKTEESKFQWMVNFVVKAEAFS